MQCAGPLWSGALWDTKITKKMADITEEKTVKRIATEAQIDSVGFYDVHKYCEKHKKSVPSFEKILKEIRKKYPAAVTHFNLTGIRTTMPAQEFDTIIKKI